MKRQMVRILCFSVICLPLLTVPAFADTAASGTSGILGMVLPFGIMFLAMYFLMIRPQRKKDKAIREMRSSLGVGDEIVTIGGIRGKIVKTKDDTIVIQVGADKVKFEMEKWSISSVISSKSSGAATAADATEEEPKKAKPKKLGKAAAEAEVAVEAEAVVEEVASAEVVESKEVEIAAEEEEKN